MKIRYKTKLSLTQFAKLLEVGKVAASRWENGHAAPSIQVAKKMLKVLPPYGVTQEQIIKELLAAWFPESITPDVDRSIRPYHEKDFAHYED
jgi:transcriptional regulator with XRE-family HTH domain